MFFSRLRKIIKQSHKHGIVVSSSGWNTDIDSAVQRLWDNRNDTFRALQKQQEEIKVLQAEIKSIQDNWRDNLCCNCGHNGVCKKMQNIRYGDGCIDHLEVRHG